jgi:30S ribosome assembly GTPase
MSKVNIVRRCDNCGSVLQSVDEGEPGYISPLLLATASLERILFCDKCYAESRFSLLPKEPTVSKDFLTMLLDAKASDAMIVYLVDLFSFECSFIPEISEIIRSLPILVLANKRDLMPQEAKDDDLREYVAHRFRVAGLPLQSTDVILTSLTSDSDLRDVSSRMEERRRRHDVYVIGASQAGKSLFLSSFIRGYVNRSPRPIITKDYPGTSLQVMQIPLDSSSSIFDTPGTDIRNSILGLEDPELKMTVLPQKPLGKRNYSLSVGQALFFGGVARVDLVASSIKKNEINAYFSDAVDIKKTGGGTEGDAAFLKIIEKKVLHPVSSLVTSYLDMDIFDFAIEEKGRRDLGIAGLGWISFEGAGQKFRFYVPKEVGVYGSRAKVK